jgi:hypothetical protein
VAQDGSTYARLHFSAGPGGDTLIPVWVDYSCEFEGSDFKLWTQQYKQNVIPESITKQQTNSKLSAEEKEFQLFGDEDFTNVPFYDSDQLISEIDLMDPMEREAFIDELAVRSDFWDEETEVFYG